MWYSICNRHGTIKRSEKRQVVERRTMEHSTSNDDCRVGIFEIAEHDKTKREITKQVNQCFKRLNANSHGQKVEQL